MDQTDASGPPGGLMSIFDAVQQFEATLRAALGAYGIPYDVQTGIFVIADLLLLGLFARRLEGWPRTITVSFTVVVLIYLFQPWAKLPGVS